MNTTTITIRRVKLDYLGYTKQGRYFGVGRKLWKILTDTEDDSSVDYKRADDYQDLRESMKAHGMVAR